MDSIQRGERAKQILNDQIVQDAFQEIEESLIEIWKDNRCTEDREELWYTLRGFQMFKQCFESTIQDGQFDRAQLEQRG